MTGEFEGYASLFGVADPAGDVVLPGAFRESLKKRGVSGIRMLFQHDPAEPLGRWLEIREDARGLFVRGRLSLEVQRASELDVLLRGGGIDGLSIGFKTLEARRDRGTGLRRVAKIDLWEISLVTFPLLAGARVTTLCSLPIEGRGAAGQFQPSTTRGAR
jgi:HK97 family phage prohead protease